MISVDDFLLFADRTYVGFGQALDRLDDSTVNETPDLPAANSPFQLVIHTVSAVEWWTSHIILGNPTNRNRPAEFEAAGTLAEARQALESSKANLHKLAPTIAEAKGIVNEAQTQTPLAGEWTVGACMIHVYEELAQHLGHLELTVDLVAPAQ